MTSLQKGDRALTGLRWAYTNLLGLANSVDVAMRPKMKVVTSSNRSSNSINSSSSSSSRGSQELVVTVRPEGEVVTPEAGLLHGRSFAMAVQRRGI